MERTHGRSDHFFGWPLVGALLLALIAALGSARVVRADDPPGLTVTRADDGRTIRLRPGDRFLLRLGDEFNWMTQVSDTRVIGLVIDALVPPDAQGLYEARGGGETELSATGTLRCPPNQPCAALAATFRITIEVARAGLPPVQACPLLPLWVNDAAYGSAGAGFYLDPIAHVVWTAERGWHAFAPQPPRTEPAVLWVDAVAYGSAGGGFYFDPASGLVWTAERGWHAYGPPGCPGSMTPA